MIPMNIYSKAIRKNNYVSPKRFDQKIKYINKYLDMPFIVINLYPSNTIVNAMLIVDKNNKKDNILICSNLNNDKSLTIINT